MAKGRPRAFDTETALDQALYLFWRKGYEGTSISDLTEAMGINAPSLYKAFGNKEQLFIRILDRYAEGPAAYMIEAFQQPTARKMIEALLYGAARATTDPATPGGCLTIHGALSTGEAGQTVKHELDVRRAGGETAMRERFKQAQAEGELPGDVDAADLAAFYSTIFQGLAVQGGAGASETKLRRVVDLALQLWPGSAQ
ncbi:TetR/AcrR family transcriptional regulator [Paenibacillus sp. NFR01]|uniref:TetR/AcrR family transcriptional regulator n=1 Tax=Paenibacillus sp. NFR01 TaxID=1566279 RepID=UPI0008B56E6E|nr:TetR/AcrR family transcriptional regulator [Paenibacillus sp. NFR01]SET15581.1 transcriptional regulator, TetR family [Paenibacillus sp. NFR01]